MPTTGYFRAMSVMTLGHLGKATVLMVKVRYTSLSSVICLVNPLGG